MFPAFKGKIVHSTAKTKRQSIKNEKYFDVRTSSEFLRTCFFKKVVSQWNTSPENIEN